MIGSLDVTNSTNRRLLSAVCAVDVGQTRSWTRQSSVPVQLSTEVWRLRRQGVV